MSEVLQHELFHICETQWHWILIILDTESIYYFPDIQLG